MNTGRKVILAVVVAAVLAGIAGTAFREPILARLNSAGHNNSLLLSGNIEAHESVLSFKTVQSRIVQLPFNEGQWVKKGTLLAAVDDADYSQQVLISEAGLALQQRQLDTSRKSLDCCRRSRTAPAKPGLRSQPCTAQTGVPLRGGAGPDRYRAQAGSGSARARPRPRVRGRSQCQGGPSRREKQRAGACAGAHRSRLHRPVGAIRRRGYRAAGGTRRSGGARHAGGDDRRPGSHLAARLRERDRRRQGASRAGCHSHHRQSSAQAVFRPGFLHRIESRIHAEERRNACRARNPGLPGQNRRRQPRP